MKNLILIFLLLGFVTRCKKAPQKITSEIPEVVKPQDHPDLVAATDVLHGFYQWYNVFQKNNNINFINDKGKHLKLDLPKLDAYLAHFNNSGYVSSSFITNEKAYYKRCETFWQKEGKEGPPMGLDADKYFCAQDWDINFWTTAPVSAEGLGSNNIKATMSGTEGGAPRNQKFDLVKENGKWVIANIDCQMLPNNPPVAEVTVPYAVAVNRQGDMTLGSKKVEFDNLKKELQNILVKQPIFPKTIPIKYDSELLMGMRGEVETEVNEAIAAAKKAIKDKKKAVTPNKSPSSLSLVVNQKGVITLAGKTVPLEDLKKELQNTLVKQAVVPKDVPIKYIGEVGMGMRAEVGTEVAGAIAGAKWLKKSKTAIPVSYSTKSPVSIALTVTEDGSMTLAGKNIAFPNLKKEVQKTMLKQAVIPNELNINFVGTIGMGMRGEVRTEVSEAIAGAKWLRKKAALEVLRKPIEKKLTIPVQFEVNDYKTSGNFALVLLTLLHKNGKPMDYRGTPYERQYRLGGSLSDNVFGLLKYKNGAWEILTYSLGATDVPHINWQEEYNAPKVLFD